MKSLGLSQTALARRMKVSRPYVTKVLSGDVNISFRTAAKFARALQLDFLPVLKPVEEGRFCAMASPSGGSQLVATAPLPPPASI